MYSVLGNAALPALGFPIRRSAGQRLFSASPRLFAAVHVLLRLLVPRHPPCALSILTVSTRARLAHGRVSYPYFGLYVQFSSSAEAAGGGLPPSGLWKLSSARAPARPPGTSPGGRHRASHVRSTFQERRPRATRLPSPRSVFDRGVVSSLERR
jgi:hypothetical protein